jgi:hypothetical protein
MIRLLRDNDYLPQIQADNLAQILDSVEDFRLEMEQTAQAEMISYLVQRYITSEVFTNTTVFDITTTYFGKNLIEYTEPTFDALVVYTTNQRVVFDKNIYNSIAGSAAHAFVPAEWTLIAADKSLYFAKLNEAEYSNKTTYEENDLVWYQNIVYTALGQTTGNLPTDASFWTAGATYSFSGDLPDDTSKWTKGDNRNQQIKAYLVDITLYHLYSRINPRNIPELRMIRYDGNSPKQHGGAIGWLKMVAGGEVNADLPEILPSQGVSIMGGSKPKRNNLPDNW